MLSYPVDRRAHFLPAVWLVAALSLILPRAGRHP